MISKTILRYIWLLDTVLKKGPITINELTLLWTESPLYDGSDLSIRTFHEHRKGVEELFGVKIACKKEFQGPYRYEAANPEVLGQRRLQEWMLHNYSIPQGFSTFNSLKNKILLEEIRLGKDYLNDILDAMRKNEEVIIDYQKFEGHRESFIVQPFALKVYHHRWYLLGYLPKKESLRHFALERIIQIEHTNNLFTYPKGFNPQNYYKDVVGIYVDENLPIIDLKLRCYGTQIEYLRSSPIHKSQREVYTIGNNYADFTYKVCLTPELTIQILALGANIEVLEPIAYREEIKSKIRASLERYEK